MWGAYDPFIYKYTYIYINTVSTFYCCLYNFTISDKGKYGESPEGFLAYVKEQIGALNKCEARANYTHKECALYFEALGNEEEVLFFHADQVSVSIQEISCRPGERIYTGEFMPMWRYNTIGLMGPWTSIPGMFAVDERDVRPIPRNMATTLSKEELSYHQEWRLFQRSSKDSERSER